MNRSSNIHLKLAGILMILLGAGSILAIQLLLKNGEEIPAQLTVISANDAFTGLLYLYGMNAVRILTGILGIALSGKKSLATMTLGIFLFFTQLAAFIETGNDMTQITLNILLLVIPFYYLYSAYNNYRNY